MDKGFLIVAQNNSSHDYLKCAKVLAKSIKNVIPSASVSLLTNKKNNHYDYGVYDEVIIFPYGDQCVKTDWKLDNDWQVYESSPYKYTIKLEADMYLPTNIEYWWDILSNRELNICTSIRNYKNEISNIRYYRLSIDNNKLPDTYNAITYFKKGSISKDFYDIVKDVFQNWDTWKNELLVPKNEPATTDIVYGIASRIIGEEYTTLPKFTGMSMIHMKPEINFIRNDWVKELTYEIYSNTMRISTYSQLYPVHYHIKDFATIIEKELGW